MTAYFDGGDWFAYGYTDGYRASWWDDADLLDDEDYIAYSEGYFAGEGDREADR